VTSLKWRIAIGYTLLLAVVISAVGIMITFRFQAILYEQAQRRIDKTMSQIVSAVTPSGNPLALEDITGNVYERLMNSENIAHWDSPSTYIQIDAPNGAVLNKSSYLAAMQFPPNPALTAATKGSLYRTVNLSSGPFLIEDRYLHLPRNQAVIVHVGDPLDALLHTFAQTQRAIIFILVTAIVALIIFSVLLASQITGPINQLARTMREIGTDRLAFEARASGAHVRRAAERHDEIGQLTNSFQDLLLRLAEAFARERQFISDASHELKTPLTSINGNAQLLLRWGDRDEAIRRESLETIARESGELAGMVSGMLTLAKADRGDEIPTEPLSLATLAQEAALASAQRAAEKHLALQVGPVDENAMILGDHGLVRQLILNIIDNAIKFTDHGSVYISTGKSEAEAWIEVRDTGPGIPEDELPRVFERFYRADKARSRTVPGTGLGLAIVSSIARVHDGRVEARRATERGGTIFTATFPALIALLFFLLATIARTWAGSAILDVGASPVFNIQIASGTVTIKTWNRNQVEIDTQGNVHWRHLSEDQVANGIPTEFSTLVQSVATPQGTAILPAETWIVPSLPPQPHDGMVLRGNGDTTITIPAASALVAAQITRGSVVLQDYHGGIFFATVHTGSIVFRNVAGTGFAQVLRGPIVAVNSSFDRLRARTAAGNILFENVSSRQIEVTSIRGSIVYDNSSFQPGFARFESQYGNVALGIGSGGAQIGAHSDAGRIVTNFNGRGTSFRLDNAGNVDAHAIVGGGGPAVTANSSRGAVVLYDGRLSDHPSIAQRMPAVRAFYERALQQKLPQYDHIKLKSMLR
jgi:signal transduction histidine kinase